MLKIINATYDKLDVTDILIDKIYVEHNESKYN